MQPQPAVQFLGPEREVALENLRAASLQLALQPCGVVRLDAVDFEDAAQHALGAFGGESVAVLAPAVGAAREVQPYEAGLLQGHVGNDEPAVARRAERRGRLSGMLAGPGRELAQPDGRGGEQRSRAVGVDHHLLALAADRDGLHAAAGKSRSASSVSKSGGVLHAQPLRRPADERSEREDVGRARLQPHLPAAFRRTAVGVGVDPVEAQPPPARGTPRPKSRRPRCFRRRAVRSSPRRCGRAWRRARASPRGGSGGSGRARPRPVRR